MLFSETLLAMRVSNAVALVTLFRVCFALDVTLGVSPGGPDSRWPRSACSWWPSPWRSGGEHESAAAKRRRGGRTARSATGLCRTVQRGCTVATFRPRMRRWPIPRPHVLHPPDDSNFLLVIATADRGSLHLEARYNYEALDTGSLFRPAGHSRVATSLT